MKIKNLHYFSGITISIFIGLHLFNHLYSVFGAEAHIELMDKLRMVYRNIFVEALLLVAIFIQIFSGLKLFRAKRKQVSNFFEKLQIYTGLYLAFFFIMHLSAVFGGRFILELDTNFYFGVAGLNTFPFFLFFIPYYGLGIFCFFGHIAAIHHQKMKASIFGISPKHQSYTILVTGILFTIVTFYGLTHHFTGVEIPAAYHILIGK